MLALDRDEKSMASTQRLVASLRAAGIASELYLGQGGMNAQLKYADRRRSRVAVIQGSNERDAPGGPQVTIRDLKLGAELAKSTKDRADYLELRQRAQFSAPEADLVEPGARGSGAAVGGIGGPAKAGVQADALGLAAGSATSAHSRSLPVGAEIGNPCPLSACEI